MKTTVKCIIKYALIFEIIVGIIGQTGEFVLRINEYMDFFTELNIHEFDIYAILLAIGVVFYIINLVFIVAVLFELIFIIVLVSIVWTAQLCLSLTLLSVAIKASVFTILIISIVLILVLIFVSIIFDEKQQLKDKNSPKMTIKLINANDLDEL